MKYTKKTPEKRETIITRNKSVIGDSIEIMVERLMTGEGIEGIEDRDLVYNDGETNEVNPVTNIRSDKLELMLDEKIGEQDYKRKKMKVIKDKEDEKNLEIEGTDDTSKTAE